MIKIEFFAIKTLTIILLFSMLTISMSAQKGKEYWENGNLKSITNYSDGKKDGIYKSYYKDGITKESGRYANGIKIGAWRTYYFNSKIKEVSYFNQGMLLNFSTYYIDSQMIAEGFFDENEKRNKTWIQHYENGELKLKGDYQHGKKHGTWKYFNPYGVIYKIQNYEYGVKTSKWETNYNTGNESVTRDSKRVSYYNGIKLDGEWKFYNENEKCIEIGNFKNDKKDGKWTYYYNNGQLKKVQLWNEGKLFEVTSYFDDKGNSLDKGTLKEGNGTVKKYDSNGLISTDEYVNGKLLDWDNYTTLNSLAWNVYENENDTKKLTKAIRWVERSIELDKNYYNSDTYAALLYKIGKYKKALSIAQEAIDIAKKSNENYSVTTKLIVEIQHKLKNEK